ncbi:TPA: hypothetical protein ACXIBV_001803 [Staphylococcus aureus]|uniref:hypothetical protein n=1 Tax=Staphylococcus aureus TaxID=1280 RepID=UPI0020220A4C|nr:hypothetical protein [Staphylococcus aureus]MCL7580426.1 hypothetical protein [Staphylococcus aureus]MCL7605990.1 hypothetical protein [Staphylococcus aureus]HDJ3886365.1 hypothetical protein [Staphylococcus aureus]HEH0930235.1 hypothetical protein [Staphylococcus aureus]HEH3010436.1 hypothetical protein [Staphylococcus aureus]
MTTALIGVIVLILLIISFVPNYRAMKSAKEQGSNATRVTIMVGIDIILIVLIIVTLLLKYM